MRALSVLSLAGLLGNAAAFAAPVELVFVAEITSVSNSGFGAFGSALQTQREVGDLFLISIAYDDAATPLTSGSFGTAYPIEAIGTTVGMSHFGPLTGSQSPDMSVSVDDQSFGGTPDDLSFSGEVNSLRMSLRFIDGTGQLLQDESLPACFDFEALSAQSFASGSFDGGLAIAVFGMFAFYGPDFNFEIVGQISGFCDGVDRPFAVADSRITEASLGATALSVQLDASGSLGEVSSYLWEPVTSSPAPANPNAANTNVELPAGTHRYRLTATHPDGGTHTDEVQIVVGAPPPDDTCPADVNGDGLATPADFTAWLAAFNVGCP